MTSKVWYTGAMVSSVVQQLSSLLGPSHVSTDPGVLAGRSVDYTGRYHGRAGALVRPGSADEVAEVLRIYREAGTHVTIQGGRTSLVAGTVPEPLLATEPAGPVAMMGVHGTADPIVPYGGGPVAGGGRRGRVASVDATAAW